MREGKVYVLHQESHRILVTFSGLFDPFWLATRPQGQKVDKLTSSMKNKYLVDN